MILCLQIGSNAHQVTTDSLRLGVEFTKSPLTQSPNSDTMLNGFKVIFTEHRELTLKDDNTEGHELHIY
jgi:hypothetical protein